jgi:zinc D-Ala-D-Ala carboxypeptidase
MKDYFPEKPWACKCGCGYNKISPFLVSRLNEAREKAGIPFNIISACRCSKHNAEEGGEINSAHLTGEAVDIMLTGVVSLSRIVIVESLLSVGFRRIGIGKTFVHADVSLILPHPRMWLY